MPGFSFGLFPENPCLGLVVELDGVAGYPVSVPGDLSNIELFFGTSGSFPAKGYGGKCCWSRSCCTFVLSCFCRQMDYSRENIVDRKGIPQLTR